MDTKVVSIPFVGGMNEFNDPDQLPPPELVECTEAVIRRPGRIEKRHGFTLVQATPGVPATAYGGGPAVPSGSVEALDGYYGQNGARAVMAAGNSLYEYVGSDSTHGWRYVNKLPSYVGSLVSVTASGGSVIETETMEDTLGIYRLTVWVSGQRTGQERTSDLIYAAQTVGGGNAIYYAVQLVATGAFIMPPTLLRSSTSAASQLYNLRATRITAADLSSKSYVAWQEAATGKVRGVVIDITTGAATASAVVVSSNLGQTCHRAFDIVGLHPSILPNGILVVYGAADPASDTVPAVLLGVTKTVNTTTGGLTTTASVADLVNHTVPAGGGYNAWAHRGVVLDQEAASDGKVAFAARTVSSYYSDSSTNSFELDGTIVLGRAVVTASTVARDTNQVYLPQLGFTTQDSHASIFATVAGPTNLSYSVDVTTLGTLPAVVVYPNVVLPFSSSLTITGRIGTPSTIQQYSINTSQGSYAPTAPYFAADQPLIAASGLYPKVYHVYPGGVQAAPSIPAQQTNWITWANTSGALSIGVYPGCNIFGPSVSAGAFVIGETYRIVSVGTTNFVAIGASANTVGIVFVATGAGTGTGTAAVRLATATIATDAATGHFTEVAIEDGTTSYAYAATNSSVAISSITGGFTVTSGAGTMTTGVCHTIKPSSGTVPVWYDIPDTSNNATSPAYHASNGYEHCVHRWSVASTGTYVALAVTSTSANVVTTPNGQEPYGAADPHNSNNFFEVYKWNPAVAALNTSLVTSGSPVSCLIGALGGPWRLVSGLQVLGANASAGIDVGCAISPSGDEGQRNTMLVRVGSDAGTATITYAAVSPELPTGASGYTYGDNSGMLVESANMMRVTSLPLNVPRLTVTSRGFLSSGLRDGVAKGTQQVFALDYEGTSQNWRKMQVCSDYTFINGGVPSVFDGVGCNEVVPLVWPQYDLTSINWASTPDVYKTTESNSIFGTDYVNMPCAFFDNYANSNGSFLLVSITRPYFKYEAGFLNKNGYVQQVGGLTPIGLGNAWSTINTVWGGFPSKNYESVYSDPRISQFSSSAPSGTGFNQSSESGQHYYGRYQNNPCDFDINSPKTSLQLGDWSVFVWAPRTAPGWGAGPITNTWFGTDSVYSSADSGGDFLMRWTYEYVDGTGRVVRSAPSIATQYTICAQIYGGLQQLTDDVAPYTGGLVSVFQYGFFAPRLELTNRLSTAASDPRRMTTQPYTTAEPFSTVLYRMPFSNFGNSASDFVIDRNVTRAVVPYTATAYDGAYNGTGTVPLGLVTTNLTCFDGGTKAYNGILSEPYLYTTGGILDNVPPPAAKAMCVHQNRLVLGGADDTTVVWFSKPITPTEGPGFNEQLTITISDGGPVTGLASLGENLIVFKLQDVFVVPGTFPDASGNGPSLGEPYSLSSGVGCIDHRSVVDTPVGVFFQSERGLELLTSALEVIPMVKVRETLKLFPYITSTVHYPTNREVWFVCHDSKIGAVFQNPTAEIIIYNYQTGTFSKFVTPGDSNYLGRGMYHAALVNSDMWLACKSDAYYGTDQAFAYTYDTSLYYDTTRGIGVGYKNFVKITVQTAPISMNEVQGFQRLKRVRLLGTAISPAGTSDYGQAAIGLLTDYTLSLANAQQASWTNAQMTTVINAQGRAQFEVHVREQKGQKVSVYYIEGAPVSVTGNGFGLALSNIAVVVGLKSGLDKRITSEAKH
jgi:hypothetical protein